MKDSKGDQAGRKALPQYRPCPVPVGIIKAVEVKAGLALPKDAVISVVGTRDE
ncbi:MAG: DUF6951 family protein [Desulfatiglandales bacterium]